MNKDWENVEQAKTPIAFATAYLGYLEGCSARTGYTSPSRKVIITGMREIVSTLNRYDGSIRDMKILDQPT